MDYLVIEDSCFTIDGAVVYKYKAGDVVQSHSDMERLYLNELATQGVVQPLQSRTSSKVETASE